MSVNPMSLCIILGSIYVPEKVVSSTKMVSICAISQAVTEGPVSDPTQKEIQSVLHQNVDCIFRPAIDK